MNGHPAASVSRIAPVDGLRALAVLGVIWAHAWALCGTPTMSIGHWGSFSFDLQRLFSMFGTGVDLFFVISGFCMYLMYIRKQTDMSWSAYGLFMKRRWLRLAPAFYTACVVSVVGLWLAGMPFYWRSFLVNVGFIHIFFHGLKALSPPFWSLATEWHFYMVLPFILLGIMRWGFRRVLWAMIAACLFFRVWVALQPESVIRFWANQLPPRLIEFSWGILVAHWIEEKRMPPRLLRGNIGFMVGLVVVLAGRVLLTREIAHLCGRWAPIPAMAWEPLLSFGYALLLWNVVSTRSLFSEILSHSYAQTLGRWSYSLYLWHWWPCWLIAMAAVKRLGPTLTAQYLTLGTLLIVIIPFSGLSYKFLEAPYFNHWRKKGVR